MHGFPFRASMWEPQIPVAVEAGRRVVAPDLPGFGRSAVPAERSDYSIDRYADLVAALVGELGLGRVVLVGLSMGGYIALAVARRHPDVLAGLVLADTRADPDTPRGPPDPQRPAGPGRGAGRRHAAGRRPPDPDPGRGGPPPRRGRGDAGRHDALDGPRRLDRRPRGDEAARATRPTCCRRSSSRPWSSWGRATPSRPSTSPRPWPKRSPAPASRSSPTPATSPTSKTRKSSTGPSPSSCPRSPPRPEVVSP